MGETVPVGWREVRLGEILVEQDERVGARTDLSPLSLTKAEGLVPARERFGKDLLGKDLSRYRVCRRDDFVVDPMLLWDGAVARLTRFEAGFVSPDYRVYRATKDVHAPFVSYLLSGPAAREAFANNAKGTNIRRNRISRDDFAKVGMRLPPLREQRSMSAMLDAADQQLDAAHQALSCLIRSKQMILDRLIEMASSNTPQTGLRTTHLEEVLRRIDAGHSPTAMDREPEGEEWGVLKVSAVQADRFIEAESKALPAEYSVDSEAIVAPGDVLISRANSPEHVGDCCQVPHGTYRLMLSDKTLRLVPGPEVLPEFLVALLNTTQARAFMMNEATGTSASMKNISQQAIGRLPVCMPPPAVQQKVGAALSSLRETVQCHRNAILRLRGFKLALQQSLLSGRLRVKV